MIAEAGVFGLLPPFATELQYGRRTYNCRSETVNTKPSFRPAWRAGQRCVIPADAVFEPNYETGKSVRWRIWQEGGVPFGIAGVWRRWRDPVSTSHYFTFTMLTVNADAHPFYSRFHKPTDEKRMPIFLRRDEYMPWLTCDVDQAPAFFKMYPGPFLGEADALARAPKVVGEPKAADEEVVGGKIRRRKVGKLLEQDPGPVDPPDQGSLF